MILKWIVKYIKATGFGKDLNRSITVDGEEYFLHPYDLYMFPNEDGNFTDNGIYMCYITNDKSTLYIIMDNQEFIYPYNTDEDYQKVRERMNSYLQF